MNLMQLGLVRGLVGQLIGTVGGIALAMLLRVAFTGDAWGDQGEGVLTTGIIIGGLSFLIGVGAFTDWAKWWVGIPTHLSTVHLKINRHGHAISALITTIRSSASNTA